MASKYWAGRAAARMEHYLRDSDKTVTEIGKAYAVANVAIRSEAIRLRDKYARDFDLTEEEAVRFLTQPVDRAEYNHLLAEIRLVTDPIARKRLQGKASSGAYAYRLSRLEAIEASMGAKVGQLADITRTTATNGFTGTIRDAFARSMFDIQRQMRIGFRFDPINTSTIREILRNPWNGESYSSRIWANAETLAGLLTETITAGFMRGTSNAQAAREIADRMSVGFRQAERLVRTETNYMANAAEMESYKEADIEQYEYLATLDDRTSDVCAELDGQVFAVKDAKAGENMPPLHPNCRSSTVAHFEEVDYTRLTRRAKNPITGETVRVPRSMTYKQWVSLHKETYGTDI